jgi:hypothetical protein
MRKLKNPGGTKIYVLSRAARPATWRAGLCPAAFVAARIVGDYNAARKELCPFEAGVFKMILARS